MFKNLIILSIVLGSLASCSKKSSDISTIDDTTEIQPLTLVSPEQFVMNFIIDKQVAILLFFWILLYHLLQG